MKSNEAVYNAVDGSEIRSMYWAVRWTVYWAVLGVVCDSVGGAPDWAVFRIVDVAVAEASDEDPPHPSLRDFPAAANQGAP